MNDEAVSIMEKNIEDLTTEDKTKIVGVVAATVLATGALTLIGIFVYKKIAVWNMTRKAEKPTKPSS